MTNKWPEVRLGDVAENLTVGHVGSMASEYVESGVPFLRSQDVRPYRIDFSNTKYIPRSFHERLPKSSLQPGDVVIVRTGKPGTAAVVPESIGELNCSDLVIIHPGPNISPRFLCYYINGVSAAHVDAHVVGAVQQHFNVRAAKQLPIRLPPIGVQQSIGHVLGSLDDKIDLNRRTNETLETMALALFKSWFVDFDPVHAKAKREDPVGMDAETAALFPSEFEDSAMGPIPKGWRAIPLYDMADYVNGAAYRAFQPNTESRGLPIIKIAELKSGVTGNTKHSDVEMPEKYRLRDRDVLFSWSGNPDTSIDTFIWSHGEAWLNQHIFRVDVEGPHDRAFILGTLKHLRPRFAEIARNKQTTGLGHVTAGDMKRLLIAQPDSALREAWMKVADPIYEAVFLNMKQSQSLTKTRDALLPRLISGEISLDTMEIAGGTP